MADVSIRVQTSDELLGLGQNQNGHSKHLIRSCIWERSKALQRD